MWFNLAPSDLSFADAAPHRIANVVSIAAHPARVFDIVATGERQDEWFQDFVAFRWDDHDAASRGAGSTREVELKMLRVKERMLAWEPGRRFAFTVEAITLPIVKQMIEDMRFEPEGDGTRLVWHVHYTPAPLMIPVHPAARAVFGRMFQRSAEGLKRYAERR